MTTKERELLIELGKWSGRVIPTEVCREHERMAAEIEAEAKEVMPNGGLAERERSEEGRYRALVEIAA